MITCVPQKCFTLSKGANRWQKGFGPIQAIGGRGSHVTVLWPNGRTSDMIDWHMGLGAVSVGHCVPGFAESVFNELNARGASHSLEIDTPIMLARNLCELYGFPYCKLGKNGSDVTSWAVRVARSVTGRDNILRCGYHGWEDWAIDQRPSGIPECVRKMTIKFNFGDIENVRQLSDTFRPACIILEPAGQWESVEFLRELREHCTKQGIVLIFDEVITACRWDRAGAAGYYGVKPDLICLGKALGNGMPISALMGCDMLRAACEDNGAFMSGTFMGEAASSAAAIWTLCQHEKYRYHMHAYRIGSALRDGFTKINMRCTPCKQWFCSQPPEGVDGDRFQQSMLQEGILWGGSHMPCCMHTFEDVERTIEAARVSIGRAMDPSYKLIGEPNQTIFKR